MGCGTSKKCAGFKSCVRYYNNTAQALPVSDVTQLAVAGARVVDTGVSIESQPSAYTIVNRGLYYISADVTINATAAGDVVFAAYMDGVFLPCTVTNATLAVGFNTIHLETDILVEGYYGISKNITFAITTDDTATGTVEHICSGITKEA